LATKRRYKIDGGIRIARNISSGTHPFGEIFQGFESLDAVKEVFGSKTADELNSLTVEVFPQDGFMGVSDEDGHIFASQHYLNNGEEWSVYLDVVHELVHVKQFKDGRELFDRRYDYVDRPTEIEAYRVGAKEAKRIGLDDHEIFAYLEVPWISKEEHRRLAKACDLKID
jgi:hypothetical protein